jgi:ABC-type Fe3+-hydroxamate transport system, periplasmic component
MMKKILLIFFFGLGLMLAVEAHRSLADLTRPPAPPADPRRIVSLAPSVTETLFAIGLGDRVVGVTQYCDYPPEAKERPVVSGFADVNLEAVLRQRPDLVALPVDKIRNQTNLERLGLSVLPLDTRSLTGLRRTVETLGRSTGRQSQAEEVVARLDGAIARAEERAEGQPRPRVLFSIMHSYQGLGYITEINAVGKDGFFSELIEIAGGENVYQGALSFPRLSREAVIFLNPDIIIDVIPGVLDIEEVRRDWLSLTSVEAIKNNRLILLTDERDTVPGPRIYQTLEILSRAFHPDVES